MKGIWDPYVDCQIDLDGLKDDLRDALVKLDALPNLDEVIEDEVRRALIEYAKHACAEVSIDEPEKLHILLPSDCYGVVAAAKVDVIEELNTFADDVLSDSVVEECDELHRSVCAAWADALEPLVEKLRLAAKAP